MVIDLFEECVQQYPSNVALLLEDETSLTYSDLSTLSSKIQQLVYQIVKKTKNENDSNTPLIAVMTDRNISFIVSMLGILRAGAAYVPVDPSFPPDRQVHIFNHSQCEFLIIDDVSFDSAVSLGVALPPLIKMDSHGHILEITIPGVSLDGFHNPTEIVEYRKKNGDERLAYVLYTSGSTGKPKGVMVKNIGVVNIVSWFADQIGIKSTTRVMGLTTFCFDISVLEMCMPLIRGGALVLGKTSSQKDPFTLLEVIKRLNVSVFQATPTTYEMMLATGWKGDATVDFLVGGEAFRPTLLPLASNCRSLRNVCKSCLLLVFTVIFCRLV